MSTEPTTGEQDHPEDAWPPTETPDARMTGEGSPPAPDDQEPDEPADPPEEA
ncbi:hypothetical protein [Kitasatospora sp. NPDC051914]|uniref:hypothetical protein n=1 Tax=Kitasatospora sp. NPDC051914 TaxID=3154945 RepID=UPI00344444A3